MRVVPGISVDRGRIKVAHRVENGHATGVPGGSGVEQLRASEDGWRRRPIWESRDTWKKGNLECNSRGGWGAL